MIGLFAWLGGTVACALLCLWIAFRQPRPVRYCHFTKITEAADYIIRSELAGYFCLMSTDKHGIIKVECYRTRKDPQS